VPQNATARAALARRQPAGTPLAAAVVMLNPEYEPSAARAVARVKHLRMRAGLLSFFAAVLAAFLPLIAVLPLERNQVGHAVVGSAAVVAACWATCRLARRDRVYARELEEAIEPLRIKAESLEAQG
jgi:hypothetical protein